MKRKRAKTQLEMVKSVRKRICPNTKLIPPLRGYGSKYKRNKQIPPE